MAQRKSTTKRMQQALDVAVNMSSQDQVAAKRAEQTRTLRTTVLLDQVKNRSEDTRELNEVHVASLVESISVLGLLEPLVIDIKNRLLAGGHRLAALHVLREEDVETFLKLFPEEQVPVRVMPFDAFEEPELALQCEVAENEHRRDYTPNEVKVLAERLKRSGYSHGKGRPSKGKKPLLPALEVIIGKHTRTIQRYLSEGNPALENTTNVVFSKDIKNLTKVYRALQSWQSNQSDILPTSKRALLAKRLPGFLKLVDQVIRELEES